METKITTAKQAFTCGLINQFLVQGFDVKEASALAERAVGQIKVANTRRSSIRQQILSLVKG